MRLLQASSRNRWPAPCRSVRDSSNTVPSADSTTRTMGAVLYTASTLAMVMGRTLRFHEWSYAQLLTPHRDLTTPPSHTTRRGQSGLHPIPERPQVRRPCSPVIAILCGVAAAGLDSRRARTPL